jgi:hypothetical protein
LRNDTEIQETLQRVALLPISIVFGELHPAGSPKSRKVEWLARDGWRLPEVSRDTGMSFGELGTKVFGKTSHFGGHRLSSGSGACGTGYASTLAASHGSMGVLCFRSQREK